MAHSDIAQELSEKLGVTPCFASLLVSRGITTPDDAKRFLYPDDSMLSDPYLLTGMQDAVERINQAIDGGEKVVIYGDYDCDGICATAILYDYLLKRGVDVMYYIPNRYDDGYGLNVNTLEAIAENYFPDLIITVDCGISGVEEAEHLSEVLAIDLIITDHHTLPDVLPNAIIVNPKQDVGSFAYDLCGAGVAFKVVQAMDEDAALSYLDVAAIATVADVVPLVDENRVIASLGIRKLNGPGVRKGLKMLIASADLQEITANEIAFKIAPRINAVGRVGDATEVVKLFCVEEYLELQGLVDKISRDNDYRQSLVGKIYEEAKQQVRQTDLALHKAIFLYDKNWMVGILGLVAARLCKELNRPVFMFCGEDVLRGSARSPEGINVYNCIKQAADKLESFGGHSGAAGLSVKWENLFRARDVMDDYLNATYAPEAFTQKFFADMDVTPDMLTEQFAKELALLEPTGFCNKKPVFAFSSSDLKLQPLGDRPHLKAKFNACTDVIAFSFAHLLNGIRLGVDYKLYAECARRTYKNRDYTELKVLAAKPQTVQFADFDIYAFERYLHSNSYPESGQCKFVPIKLSEAPNCLYDDDFATAYCAFSTATSKNFVNQNGNLNVLKEFYQSVSLPSNTLIVAPECDFTLYRRIILLDTPLSKGYISYLNKCSDAEIYVVTDNYPFVKEFLAMDMSYEAISESKEYVRKFVLSGNGAASPAELADKLPVANKAQFLTHFYCLYGCGEIRVGERFSLQVNNGNDLNASVLFRRINALKKQYENL